MAIARAPRTADWWRRYPVRTCYALHHCQVCDRDIVRHERYHDGGWTGRAHVDCVGRLDNLESAQHESEPAKENDDASSK